jgi:superfamily II DNA or RNA helicase
MGYAAYKEPRIIETWQLNDGELSFPRGGMQRVREVIQEWGETFRVTDGRTLGDRTVGVPPPHSLQLYDYQEHCVEAALEREQGIIRSGTGSGKTTFCLALAARVGVPTLVVVHTTALLKQWVERVRREMNFEPGVIQGARREIRPLTVAMQQTLNGADDKLWREIDRVFGAVIADECHLFSASTFLRTVDRCSARTWSAASSCSTSRPCSSRLSSRRASTWRIVKRSR